MGQRLHPDGPLHGERLRSLRRPGRTLLLEPSSTPKVVEALWTGGQEREVRLRATREIREQEMYTTPIDEV